jgi:hypothetical protein
LALPDGQQALGFRVLAARSRSRILRASAEPGSCWALFLSAI